MAEKTICVAFGDWAAALGRTDRPKTVAATSRKPSSEFNLDSTLIKSKHVPLFASWIDKKNSSHYNKKNVPYEFRLLYRSSRDRFDAASFHRNCDSKGATIWMAKSKIQIKLLGDIIHSIGMEIEVGRKLWIVFYLILRMVKIYLLQD